MLTCDNENMGTFFDNVFITDQDLGWSSRENKRIWGILSITAHLIISVVAQIHANVCKLEK